MSAGGRRGGWGRRRALLFGVLGLALVALFALSAEARRALFYLADVTPPRLNVAPPAGPFGPEIRLAVEVEDRNPVELFYRIAPNAPAQPFEGPELVVPTAGLTEGTLRLTLIARDASLLGNRAELVVPVDLDLTPPTLTLESDANLWTRQGFTTYVIFRHDEPVWPLRRDVATIPAGTDLGVVLLPLPVDAPPGERTELIEFRDAAGNRAHLAPRLHVKATRFASGRVTLTPAILAKINAADFEEEERLRAENNQKILDIASARRQPSDFDFDFRMPMPGTWTSTFGEKRLYNGKGRHRHLAMDIAHVAGASVAATARGLVAFAGPLGIYGNALIIDHGYGIFSLSSHLASLAVKEGDQVEQGQPVGVMGATGLAGGEHLHFSIIVAGTYVNPDQFFQMMKKLRGALSSRLDRGAAMGESETS